MQLTDKEKADFIVHHKITEDKLLKLEKGVRRLGFDSNGRKLVVALFSVGVCALILALFLDGSPKLIAAGVGFLCLIALLFCLYTIVNGWRNAKKVIHRNFEDGKPGNEYDWEYRFFDQYYEVIGPNETARIRYTHIGRLLDFSGMLVLVEKGNVVRFFLKEDAENGGGDRLAEFLERKAELRFEAVRA